MLPGVADHDADIVPSALDALRFLAVERLPHLPPQILQPQPERFGRGPDVQPHLRLAGTNGIGDRVNAGVLGQPALEHVGGGPQTVEIPPGKLHVYVLPGAQKRRVEVDRERFRNRAGLLAPQDAELLAGVRACLRGRELDGDLAYIGSGHHVGVDPSHPAAAPRLHRLIADRRRHVPEVVEAGLPLQSRAQPCGARLVLRHGLGGCFGRGAQRHSDRRGHELALDRRGELELGPAAQREAAGEYQGGQPDPAR